MTPDGLPVPASTTRRPVNWREIDRQIMEIHPGILPLHIDRMTLSEIGIALEKAGGPPPAYDEPPGLSRAEKIQAARDYWGT